MHVAERILPYTEDIDHSVVYAPFTQISELNSRKRFDWHCLHFKPTGFLYAP